MFHYCLSLSKVHGLKVYGIYHIKSGIGHTFLKQKSEKNTQNNFCQSVQKSDEKKVKKKTGIDDNSSVCMLNLVPKVNTLPSVVAINLVKVDIKSF